ncbi:MAG: RNA methyltransferase [Gammaproteobacteria bacterium]|nr:RNA methyltransferase [Gammaproteobacteria bacterium]
MPNVRIVLVEPDHPGNIGGAARAMKNMGLTDLALVRPARYPDPQAEWRAAQAVDVLDAARVFDSLEDAVADCGLVAGTSARARRVPWPTDTAAQFAERVAVHGGERPVAVLFGREASGLTNEELQRCRVHVVIPADDAYASLNLAMSVQVVCYELRKASLGVEADAAGRSWDRELASAADVEGFHEHLEAVLRLIDFHDPAAPRQSLTRLRRLFARVEMDETEVAMLRGILTHVERAVGARTSGRVREPFKLR